jgi:hypothetical protein
MRRLLVVFSVGITLTALFAASAPEASARPIACIGNGHSCTHDNNCCSNNCVNRTCR